MELDVSWLKLVNQSQKIPNLSGTLRISEHLAEIRRDKLCVLRLVMDSLRRNHPVFGLNFWPKLFPLGPRL